MVSKNPITEAKKMLSPNEERILEALKNTGLRTKELIRKTKISNPNIYRYLGSLKIKKRIEKVGLLWQIKNQ